MINNFLKKFILISSTGMASVLGYLLPANASVFYDLEFYNQTGELVGTGEFSHEEDPFDGTINLCLIEVICGETPLEIKKEDNFFRLDSFFSTIPGLNFGVGNRRSHYFWRPFDEEKVASTSSCPYSGCFHTLNFSSSSWYIDGRTFSVRMSATNWGIGGLGVPNNSGTWTATRRTSIPEPASTLGLIGVGVLGVGSQWKRKGNG